jgi:hypothetical protein
MSRSRVRGPHAGALAACALLAALLGCAEAFAPSIMGLAASQYCSRVSKRGPACAIGAHHVISAWWEGSALSPSLRTRRQQHGQLLAMSPSLDDFGDGTEQQDQASSSDLPSMRKALQSTKKAEAPADMHKALRACPGAATKVSDTSLPLPLSLSLSLLLSIPPSLPLSLPLNLLLPSHFARFAREHDVCPISCGIRRVSSGTWLPASIRSGGGRERERKRERKRKRERRREREGGREREGERGRERWK